MKPWMDGGPDASAVLERTRPFSHILGTEARNESLAVAVPRDKSRPRRERSIKRVNLVREFTQP
jgi:hypothetical protein